MGKLGGDQSFGLGSQCGEIWLHDQARSSKTGFKEVSSKSVIQLRGRRVDGQGSSLVVEDRSLGRSWKFKGDAGSVADNKQGLVSSKERSQEILVGDQHEASQQYTSRSSCQIQGSECSPVVAQERMVDVQMRSKGRLFSCENASDGSPFHVILLEEELVSISCIALWIKTLANSLLKNYQGTGQVLEKGGDLCDSLFRQFFVYDTNLEQSYFFMNKNSTGFPEFGMDLGGVKVNMGSNSEVRISWPYYRHASRSVGGSSRQDSEDNCQVSSINEWWNSFGKGDCINGRFSNKFGTSFCPSQALHKEFLSGVEKFPKERIGLGLPSSAISTESGRHQMDSREPSNVQHKGSLEASSMETVGNRFKPERMGFSIQGDGRGEQLDGTGSYQLLGNQSHFNEFEDYPGKSQGVFASYSKQQSSSSSLFEEWRRSFNGFNNFGKADLGLVSKMGCEFSRVQMDSREIQQSPGFSKLYHGSEQLEGISRNVSSFGCSVGTTHS